jgi:undecaprenyl-diphosphatase
MNNQFDVAMSGFLNQLIGHSPWFDLLISHLITNEFLKGGVLVAIVWFLWFKQGLNQQQNRNRILLVLIASCFAAGISKILPKILPFRTRPFLNDSLYLTVPEDFPLHSFDNLSSLPSDHAALFFGLAFGIYWINKKVGIWTLVYVSSIIAIPRIIVGAHYLSDILAGGLLGFGAIYFCAKSVWLRHYSERAYSLESSNPSLFYMVFFLLSQQITMLFANLRAMASFVWKILLL